MQKKDPNKIYFSIPNYWYLRQVNLALLNLKEREPNKFYEDVIIDSCFGCFPGCVWNGGRGFNSWGSVTSETIQNIAKDFNSRGISLRHTFTNLLIEEKHLFDTVGNTILQLTENFSDVQNGCTVNSQLMFDYIKTNYPNFDLIWSTTKEISSIDEINTLSKDNLLVISYTFNNHFDKLSQLKYPHNIEILCYEEGCIDNCPLRPWHNMITSRINMCGEEYEEGFVCPRRLNDPTSYYYTTSANRFYYIDIDTIREKYLPLGFNQFKISGRSEIKASIINAIENYVNYFVKPEYKDEIRNKLLINVLAP